MNGEIRVIRYEKCLYCGSEDLIKANVGTHIAVNGPEEHYVGGGISQKQYCPSIGFVCKKCGYEALFFDWEKTPWKE